MNLYLFIATLGIAACTMDGDPEDDTGSTPMPGDDTGSGGTDGGADPGIPFEVVVEDVQIDPSWCGTAQPKGPACSEEDLLILWTDDPLMVESWFTEQIKVDAPSFGLDGRIALLSYLPVCPSYQRQLHVERLDLHGTTLQVAEQLISPPDPGDVAGCPYSLVTIPDTTAFTDIEGTLTEVWTD